MSEQQMKKWLAAIAVGGGMARVMASKLETDTPEALGFGDKTPEQLISKEWLRGFNDELYRQNQGHIELSKLYLKDMGVFSQSIPDVLPKPGDPKVTPLELPALGLDEDLSVLGASTNKDAPSN